jgi:hypothetical protein
LREPQRKARLPEGWSLQMLPGAVPGRFLALLQRSARAAPARYRVIVIPGSGCTGFAPFADRYFAGLLHAQVLVLHKPGVDLWAGPAPPDCPGDFVANDALSMWRDDASAALRSLAAGAERPTGSPAEIQPLPALLVGISEGGELLPALAPEVPRLAGGVLLSSSGLDPREAGALQAARLGLEDAWFRVSDAMNSPLPDRWRIEGRTLRYWRDLMAWRVAQALLDAPWPLLQVWGEADALIPPVAYIRFAVRAQQERSAPFCSWPLPDADHGLQQADGVDALQQVWARLETWSRQGRWPCERPEG